MKSLDGTKPDCDWDWPEVTRTQRPIRGQLEAKWPMRGQERLSAADIDWTWEARKNHGDNCATSDENKQIHYLQKHFNKPKNILHAGLWSVIKQMYLHNKFE